MDHQTEATAAAVATARQRWRAPLEILDSIYRHIDNAHPWRPEQRYMDTPQAVVWTVARRMIGR